MAITEIRSLGERRDSYEFDLNKLGSHAFLFAHRHPLSVVENLEGNSSQIAQELFSFVKQGLSDGSNEDKLRLFATLFDANLVTSQPSLRDLPYESQGNWPKIIHNLYQNSIDTQESGLYHYFSDRMTKLKNDRISDKSIFISTLINYAQRQIEGKPQGQSSQVQNQGKPLLSYRDEIVRLNPNLMAIYELPTSRQYEAARILINLITPELNGWHDANHKVLVDFIRDVGTAITDKITGSFDEERFKMLQEKNKPIKINGLQAFDHFTQAFSAPIDLENPQLYDSNPTEVLTFLQSLMYACDRRLNGQPL